MKGDINRIQTVSQMATQLKSKKRVDSNESRKKNKSRDFRMSPGLLRPCFYRSDYRGSLNPCSHIRLLNWENCKRRRGGGRERRVEETEKERREAYWGQQRALLSVISIQMCRIRCSECAAAQGWKLVLFPTQPWSRQGQIQTNEFTQTIHMERRGMCEWRRRRRGVQPRGLTFFFFR